MVSITPFGYIGDQVNKSQGIGLYEEETKKYHDEFVDNITTLEDIDTQLSDLKKYPIRQLLPLYNNNFFIEIRGRGNLPVILLRVLECHYNICPGSRSDGWNKLWHGNPLCPIAQWPSKISDVKVVDVQSNDESVQFSMEAKDIEGKLLPLVHCAVDIDTKEMRLLEKRSALAVIREEDRAEALTTSHRTQQTTSQNLTPGGNVSHSMASTSPTTFSQRSLFQWMYRMPSAYTLFSKFSHWQPRSFLHAITAMCKKYLFRW